jgi:uncharacterized protein
VITLEPHAQGVILMVRAQAVAKKNGIQGQQAGMLKVSVTQAPEKGKANKAIQAVLAAELDLRKSQIELISGDTAAQKKFLINGIAIEELRSRLAVILGET